MVSQYNHLSEMMITLQELSKFLDEILPALSFPDFCPNGLQVEGKCEVKKVALAVSASVAAIDAAVKAGVDALIVHHGIFWNKDSYVVKGPKRKKLALLLKNEISLFAYHLPLDAQNDLGNNWKAATDLGWENLQSFGDVGVKGIFNPIPVREFQAKVELYYGHSATTALGGKKSVSSAALISGGSYRCLEQAAQAGVDCFISGNFDEPAWDIAHEQEINFFALGHYATERVGIIALREELQRRLKIECQFIDLPNPF